MLEIVLNNVSKNYGNKRILKNINFEVKTNEKVALIGPNGCGKTTILKLIGKEENPTTGEVFIRKDAKVSILSQYPDESLSKEIVKDILNSSFIELNELKEKLSQAEQKLLEGTDLDKAILKFTKLQEEFIQKGGYEIDSKIEKLVAAFHVEELLEKQFKDLSGGEKTIISLIGILLKESDILLLDEPTNHLDIKMLEWLENYLSNCNKTIIIVSHDRFFLDKVTTKTILIDNGEEEIFHGNYTYYLKENEERVMREFNAYKNQQKQIEAMKTSIKRLKEYGKLAYPCGEKFFRRAASIEKRLEKMEVLDKPRNKDSINLRFNVEKRSGNDVISFNRFDLSIGDKELLKKADCLIKFKERVCIMGPNGCAAILAVVLIAAGGFAVHSQAGAVLKPAIFRHGFSACGCELNGDALLQRCKCNGPCSSINGITATDHFACRLVFDDDAAVIDHGVCLGIPAGCRRIAVSLRYDNVGQRQRRVRRYVHVDHPGRRNLAIAVLDLLPFAEALVNARANAGQIAKVDGVAGVIRAAVRRRHSVGDVHLSAAAHICRHTSGIGDSVRAVVRVVREGVLKQGLLAVTEDFVICPLDLRAGHRMNFISVPVLDHNATTIQQLVILQPVLNGHAGDIGICAVADGNSVSKGVKVVLIGVLRSGDALRDGCRLLRLNGCGVRRNAVARPVPRRAVGNLCIAVYLVRVHICGIADRVLRSGLYATARRLNHGCNINSKRIPKVVDSARRDTVCLSVFKADDKAGLIYSLPIAHGIRENQ